MELKDFLGQFGNDVYAFALVVTKSYESAKIVYMKTALSADKLSVSKTEWAAAAFSECKTADINESAETFSAEGLDEKQETLLGLVLPKPQIVRAMIHLFYANDMDAAEIARALGVSERSVRTQLESLGELNDALERLYKGICARLLPDSLLVEYALKSAENGSRLFEVKREPAPKHKWSVKSKVVIVAVAVVTAFVGMFVIPLTEMYKKMQEELYGVSYEEPATDEIFRYTLETGESEESSDSSV